MKLSIQQTSLNEFLVLQTGKRYWSSEVQFLAVFDIPFSHNSFSVVGALERQARLRELGVQKLLQQLLSTNDTTLFDK